MKIIFSIGFIYYLSFLFLPLLQKFRYTYSTISSTMPTKNKNLILSNERTKPLFSTVFLKDSWFIFAEVHKGKNCLLNNIAVLVIFILYHCVSSIYAPSGILSRVEKNNKNSSFSSNYNDEYSKNERESYESWEENLYYSEDEDRSNEIGYGYMKEDGTEVSGHYRTDPDGVEENNFSYEGEDSGVWNYVFHD